MFLLCDETQSTLSEITKKISENLNGTSQTRIMSSTSYESVLLEHPEFALLNINLIVDGSTSPLPMNNKSILESLPKVCEEFISCRGLEAMKIVLMAPVGNELKELAGELKGRYSLPLLTRRTVVDIVMKGEEGSNNVRDEVAKIWDAEEGGKDATKIPDKLLARCFRHCLDSGTCKSHGYVMYDFPETENDGYSMWSDEPETVEGEEKKEEEPVEEKKGKKDDKKGKKGKESPRDEPVEPIFKFPLNPKKGPTHVLNFPASDEYLFKLNGASPIALEEGAEPVISEAGLKYKEMLEGYRRKVASFGARPPMATEEEEKETKEDEEEGKEETKKEPEEEVSVVSVYRRNNNIYQHPNSIQILTRALRSLVRGRHRKKSSNLSRNGSKTSSPASSLHSPAMRSALKSSPSPSSTPPSRPRTSLSSSRRVASPESFS